MIFRPISILLPVYKGTNFRDFRKSIMSITYEQSVKSQEILILFDGPVDPRINTYIKLIKKNFTYTKFKLIKFPINVGLGKVLKFGIIKAKNNLIMRCDSDDISNKNRIKYLFDSYAKNKTITVIDSSMSEYVDGNTYVRSFDELKKNSKLQLKLRNVINHPTTLIKKKDILKCGNYEHMPFFEDYYLWIKLKKNNYKFSTINKVLVKTYVNNSFYKRRSGLKYLNHYRYFLNNCLKLQFINIFEYYILFFLRAIIIINNINVIKFLYKKFLRKNN